MKNFIFNRFGLIDCDIESDKYGEIPTTLTEDETKAVIDSGVEIAPYVEPVKTLEQLQQEAVSVMASIVIAECRSGTGKLYFSDLNSAARHSSAEIQPDAEIRDRAIQLLQWDIAIDAYALDVLFSIEEGGDTPAIEEFIAGLPTV
ncbi:MAG: hypothetical protein V7765_21970 [Oleispira sp.]